MNDTNLTEMLKVLVAQKALGPIVGHYDFWLQLIPAVGALVFAFVGWLNSKTAATLSQTAATAAGVAAAASEETKKMATKTTATVSNIEVKVNGKESAMMAKIDALTSEVLRLTERSAVLETKKDAADAAKS